MAKVSICIPTYENQEEVKRLLDSTREQTFEDVEIIITDDSRDKLIEDYVRMLITTDGRIGRKINYIHNQEPLGHIFNWNAAISRAHGEYIKIMFSDDWFTYPYSLEKLVRLLEERPEVSLAFCGSMQVSKGEAYARRPEAGYAERLKEDYRYLFISNQIGAPSDTLYRNSPQIRFDERSNWASDVFLYMEILKNNPAFAYTDEPLISIGIHEKQYTESFHAADERIYKDYQYLFQKYNLSESGQCREYFLKRYLIPFSRGMKEAGQNGYSSNEYLRALFSYYRKEVLPCCKRAVLRKIKGNQAVKAAEGKGKREA